MDYLKQLMQELKELEQQYSELSDMRFLRTSEDNEPFKQKLIEAGRLLVDFYDKRFVPQYSQIPDDAVEDAGKTLLSFSQSVSYCLENRMYYAISSMLANVGDRIDRPNNLERLVRKLKNELKERKKLVLIS